MEIPRHWRLRKERYALVGEICPGCNSKLFPPRDICPKCHTATIDIMAQNSTGQRVVLIRKGEIQTANNQFLGLRRREICLSETSPVKD